MSHNHSHSLSGRKLFITILLNLFITLAEVIGGLLAHSLSLLSDALHNFSDVLALVISYIAHILMEKKFTAKKTFGYKRAEILAALINVTTLLVIAVFLIREAIVRLSHPVAVNSFLVMSLAGLSIVINTISVLLLQKDAKKNLNIKSSYIHLLTDVLTSVVVLLGGVSMFLFHIQWLDSILSLLIAGFLIYSSIGILLKTLEIFMQFAPSSIDLHDIEKTVLLFPEIKNIHHIHLWQLNDNEIHLEAHIDFKKNLELKKATQIIHTLSDALLQKFHISHTNFQQEFDAEDHKSLIPDNH